MDTNSDSVLDIATLLKVLYCANPYKTSLPRLVTYKEYRKIRRFKRKGITYNILIPHNHKNIGKPFQ